jgi:hypothetical protein
MKENERMKKKKGKKSYEQLSISYGKREKHVLQIWIISGYVLPTKETFLICLCLYRHSPPFPQFICLIIILNKWGRVTLFIFIL